MSSILKKYSRNFRSSRDLDSADAETLLDALISSSDEALIAEVLQSWNEKGIEEDEIFYLATILRSRMTRVVSDRESLVDIVGTGGSRSKTFNVSTAASFVVAGEGYPVAKHGNKAATSPSGSSDVLAELGIDPAIDASVAERCLEKTGICFMYAPNHHRLSPTLANVRRGLGFPTIFNCIGPLSNPASAGHQLIGVWDRKLVSKMANALARLGTVRSWVVHGENGLDEISLSGKTFVAEIVGDRVRQFEIEPDHFGIKAGTDERLNVDSPKESAAMIRNVLSGQRAIAEAEDLVLLNALAALRLVNENGSTASVDEMREGLRAGRAERKLKELAAEVSR
jgi:anthranilate phosphoribosyltransferase